MNGTLSRTSALFLSHCKAQESVRPMTKTTIPRPATARDKVTKALAQASSQAKKQLVHQGLKLPTQSWTGSTVRNPAI